jgi:glycerophosphoryl diester phosphodiesterase
MAGPSYFIAHRGLSQQYPEDSTESWAQASLQGYMAEGDVRESSDGVLYLMHDATVDRTVPPNTGAINTFNAAALDAMRYDRYNGVGFVNTPVSRFSAAIDAVIANNGWICPEIEVTTLTGGRNVVAAIKAKNWLHRCILQMFEGSPYTILSTLVNENPTLDAMVLFGNFGAGVNRPDLRTIAEAGIRYIGVDIAQTSTWLTRTFVERAHALRLKVGVYVVDDYTTLATAQSLNVDHVFTNRAEFMAKGILDQRKPFNESWTGTAKWMFGDDYVIDGATLPSVNNPRVYNGEAGMPTAVSNAVGAYCQSRPLPAAATSYQLDFNVTLRVANADNTRWAGIQFALQQDGLVRVFAPVPAGINGYGMVFRQNGAFSIDKYVAGVNSTTIANNVSTALVVGTPVPFRLNVTATQLTLLRVDTGVSCTVADNTFRGGILGFIWAASGMYFGPITGV